MRVHGIELLLERSICLECVRLVLLCSFEGFSLDICILVEGFSQQVDTFGGMVDSLLRTGSVGFRVLNSSGKLSTVVIGSYELTAIVGVHCGLVQRFFKAGMV